MHITTIGLDIAKNIFQIHAITEDGTVAFNRPLRRAQVLPFFDRLEPLLDWYGSLWVEPLLGPRAEAGWAMK